MALPGSTHIKLKKPSVLICLVSITFVVIGIILIRSGIETKRTFTVILGILNTLLFGTSAFLSITQLLDKKSGLYFFKDHVIYTPSQFIFADIKDNDIKEIIFTKIKGVEYILPILKDPESVIRDQGMIGRRVMRMNIKQFNTPVPVITNRYVYDIETLKNHFNVLFADVK